MPGRQGSYRRGRMWHANSDSYIDSNTHAVPGRQGDNLSWWRLWYTDSDADAETGRDSSGYHHPVAHALPGRQERHRPRRRLRYGDTNAVARSLERRLTLEGCW